jgi:flagellar FliL protein
MAKQAAKPASDAGAGPHGPSFVMTLLGIFLVTAMAAGGGWLTGLQSYGLASAALQKAVKAEEPKPAHAPAPFTNLRELPPVVTNIASQEDVWIRIDASVVVDDASAPGTDILVKEIAGDFLSFLRTISLPQVQGAIGLQHLRQDLTERATIRSKGRVRELIIHAMVIQ